MVRQLRPRVADRSPQQRPILGLHAFALLMIVLNLSLFGRLGPRPASTEVG